MVYRDLPMETAEKRHSEATVTPTAPVQAPPVKVVGAKRKVVKVLDPKSK
jgi:hypothetical protein